MSDHRTAFAKALTALKEQEKRAYRQNYEKSTVYDEKHYLTILNDLVKRQETSTKDITDGSIIAAYNAECKPGQNKLTWTDLYCVSLLVWIYGLHNKVSPDGVDYRDKNLDIIGGKWLKYQKMEDTVHSPATGYHLFAGWVFGLPEEFNGMAKHIVLNFNQFTGKNPDNADETNLPLFRIKYRSSYYMPAQSKVLKGSFEFLPDTIPQHIVRQLVDTCKKFGLDKLNKPSGTEPLRLPAAALDEINIIYERIAPRANTPYDESEQSLENWSGDKFSGYHQQIKGPHHREVYERRKDDSGSDAGRSQASQGSTNAGGPGAYPYFPQN